MDQWITFAQDRWYLIVGAIVLLFIIVGIVKTLVKWLIVIVIIGALVVYGANYKDELQSIATNVAAQASTEFKDQVVKAFTAEAKEAQFKTNPDGSFLITTKSLKLEGKADSSDVLVTFLGKTFTMNAEGAIKTLIDQAKKSANP